MNAFEDRAFNEAIQKTGRKRLIIGGLHTESRVARRLDATPTQVALAWLLRRASNMLLIAGTSSLAHLRENIGAAALELSNDAVFALDALGPSGTRRQFD